MIEKRITILQLITNLSLGGAQEVMLSIANGLNKDKFEVHIAANNYGHWAEKIKLTPNIAFHEIKFLRRDISPLFDIFAIIEVIFLCKKLHVDIVHSHSSKAGFIGRIGAWIAGVPIIVHTVHGFPFHEFMSSWKRYFFIWLEKIGSKLSTTIILLSRTEYEKAAQLNIIAKDSNVILSNGIDFDAFKIKNSREAVRNSFGYDDRHFVFGFTGRLSEQKKIKNLITSFSTIKKLRQNAKLLIVGDGEQRSELDQYIFTLNLKKDVIITGYRSDVPTLLNAMDAFVMTSLWEGLSISLVEAMFLKIPVIATNVGGTAEAVRPNETGWLIPPNDIEKTVFTLLQVMDNYDIAKNLAMNGHNFVKLNFSISSMHSNMENLYIKLSKYYL